MLRDVVVLLMLAAMAAWLGGSGVVMWTGRWKSWYNPYESIHQLVYAFFGTSPLPLILTGIAGLSVTVAIVVAHASLYLAWLPLAVSVLSLLAAVYILMVRPRWADPPWLAERKRELRRQRGHPQSRA